MFKLTRREMMGALAAGAGYFGLPGEAKATLLRGMTVQALSRASQHILTGTALESESHWEVLGGRRRIVTDTRIRVDDVLAQQDPGAPEILVRTLGGTVGDLGAIVFGEAELSLQEPCVLFLSAKGQGVPRVTGLAQGHYPLRNLASQADARSALHLFRSPRLPELLGDDKLAVRRLVGLDVSRARKLVQEALKP